HVAHDESRIAGNVAAHVSGNQPRRDVIAAAGSAADEEFDRLAVVEIRNGLGGGRSGRDRRDDKNRAGDESRLRCLLVVPAKAGTHNPGPVLFTTTAPHRKCTAYRSPLSRRRQRSVTRRQAQFHFIYSASDASNRP